MLNFIFLTFHVFVYIHEDINNDNNYILNKWNIFENINIYLNMVHISISNLDVKDNLILSDAIILLAIKRKVFM